MRKLQLARHRWPVTYNQWFGGSLPQTQAVPNILRVFLAHFGNEEHYQIVCIVPHSSEFPLMMDAAEWRGYNRGKNLHSRGHPKEIQQYQPSYGSLCTWINFI